MNTPVFLFGTLRHKPVRDAVLGSAAKVEITQLRDHAVLDAGGYPVLLERSGACADGVLLWPDSEQLARLDQYEGLFGYARQCMTANAGRAVQVYRPTTPQHASQCAEPWVFKDWTARFGDAAALASADVMAHMGQHPAEHLAVRYPMLLAHACARLRGRTERSPQTLRRAARTGDAKPIETAHPYAYFFGVQSDDLRFRRFDGSYSPVVRRAAFVMSDAVTLLPYDPVRDAVLLVEQFRYGLYVRDAVNCWSLEAIAGRIDPGETPAQAALREADEEAGLDLAADALVPIGQAYPSPGAITECLFQFVALCALPQDDRAVNGLETEAEDIRRHVIGFDRLMHLAQTGELQNGPLLTTVYWLALNRDSLRDRT